MPDIIEIKGDYPSDVQAEIKYRVLERLGMTYEDRPVTKEQITEVVIQVERDL